jgi:hypothetical protein
MSDDKPIQADLASKIQSVLKNSGGDLLKSPEPDDWQQKAPISIHNEFGELDSSI